MIGMLPSLAGVEAGTKIAGTTIPISPDGKIEFDCSDSGQPVTGQFVTFTFAMDGQPVPDVC